jgi:hypothetical protein
MSLVPPFAQSVFIRLATGFLAAADIALRFEVGAASKAARRFTVSISAGLCSLFRD